MKAGEKFERIVGQYLERDGWDISYEGIEKGLCDGGIDLIGSRDGVTALIQCKFWQAHKLVHEKHLNQLRGVVEKYKVDHPEKSVCGAFVTTASISKEARRAAKIHEIEVIDQFRF